MKPNTLLTVLVAVLLSTSDTHAQRVEPALVDGYPVINCMGMPPSAYTTTKKSNVIATLKTKATNATVYQRFAVDNIDYMERNGWLEAMAACSQTQFWRLPTQRELQLIWVLKPELERTANFVAFSERYWSATEYLQTDTTSFNVVFTGSAPDEGDLGNPDQGNNTDQGGATSPNKQKLKYHIRCIKELPISK